MDGWTIEQRILFMSESNMLLHLIEENLDKEMYEIEILDCEVEGVESVEKLHPDLILLDVEGEEEQRRLNFLDVVKHHEATANIPVLLCADASQELQEQERNFQMLNIRLLYRPFNKEDLLKALQQIVYPLTSAFDATSAHQHDISRQRSTINLFSSFGQKFLPRWVLSFVASAKQHFNGEILQNSQPQQQTDRLETEEQENLSGPVSKPGNPLEEMREQEQGDLSEQTDNLEAQQEKSEKQQEQENTPEIEKQDIETLSLAS
jgi:CheY-like chemotaxis protein